jgi:uncharacterized protein (TIGR02145 family)
MTKKTVLLVLAFIMMNAASVNAQVRIGGLDDPHPAAVLDLNADDESNIGDFGLYLPRVSLTNVKQQLHATTPLNGAVVWNTNDEFYLGKGVYVWGDSVWIPIQRTPIGNSTLQPITTDPYVTILSNPALGLGATFQVPTAYADMGNTAQFLWEIKADKTPAYAPEVLISGSRREVVFVPYDDTERKYSVRAKAISNNGTSDSNWSEWMETTNEGKYRGWYMLTGATGYDIKATDYGDATKGRDGDRTQMSLSNTYTVEKIAGLDADATYSWSIPTNPGTLASLGDAGKNATVELKFNNSILSNTELVNHPDVAKTFVLQCIVNDGHTTYTLQRTITIGDRDECSPTAKLYDAEKNSYLVSKFGDAGCWMTQNLRSTYTWQGSKKQEPVKDPNNNNDPNAISYYYPALNDTNNPDEYGLLYTWGAANIGTATTEATNAYLNVPSTRQGICPDGWVVPSDYDFNQLEKEIATNPQLYTTISDAETDDGWQAMYETKTGWRPGDLNPNNAWWSRWMKSPTEVKGTTNGVSKTDGTGFNALLVGYLSGGSAINYGTYTTFWSSSAGSATAAWRRYLLSGNSGVNRSTINKYYSFAVRCKKL